MNTIYEKFQELFSKNLLQVDSERVDDLSKELLKLSTFAENRTICYESGMTSDLCDWFFKCNNYFIEISHAVTSAEFVDSPISITVSLGALSIATNITRILRNMCKNNRLSQTSVISHGIPHCIVSLCMNKYLWASGEMKWSENYELFLQISLQLLYNVTSGFDDGKSNIWNEFFPDCFLMILKQFAHNTKISSFSLGILCNCIINAENSDEERRRLIDISGNCDYMNLILSRGLQDEDENAITSWVLQVIETILTVSFKTNTSQLISNSLSSLSTPSYHIISPAQLLFLHYMQYSLDMNTDRMLGDAVCMYLIEWILDRIHDSNTLEICDDNTVQFNRDLLNVKLSKNEEGQKMILLLESIGLCLSCVSGQAGDDANQLLLLAHFSEEFKRFIMESEIYDIFMAILAVPQNDIHPLLSTSVGELGERQGTPMIKVNDMWSDGTRDAVLQILGNVIYMNREAQDKVRKSGGIELILSHTKMHAKMPLQREWALFAIRNLCADNEENQQYIDDFKVKGVATEPALDKLGVKVTMKDGKVNIESNLCVC